VWKEIERTYVLLILFRAQSIVTAVVAFLNDSEGYIVLTLFSSLSTANYDTSEIESSLPRYYAVRGR
jgi:hypothetical protein